MKGVDGPLKDAAEKVLTMKPNFSYTLQEVEDEVAHVFELGWFAKCQPNAEDTRDGVKLTIEVSCFATHLMQTLLTERKEKKSLRFSAIITGASRGGSPEHSPDKYADQPVCLP